MTSIFDGHCDVLYKMWDFQDHSGFYKDGDTLHSSFNRLRAGGVKVQTMTVFVPPDVPQSQKTQVALQMLDIFYEHVLTHESKVKVVTDLHTLQAIDTNDDVLYVILAIEGADPIPADLMYLRTFYQLGVRSIGLTWNYRNCVADGVQEPNAGGLSAFGIEFIKEMNRLKMAIDISHLSVKGFWDVIEHSTGPIMGSHCNPRALCDHVRNLYDDQIKAMYERQGLLGINFVPYFLDQSKDRVTISDVIKHIDYALSLGGEDYVGLGSDFDGITDTVERLEHSGNFPLLVNEMQKHYSETVVNKIVFHNWKNYYSRLWSNSSF